MHGVLFPLCSHTRPVICTAISALPASAGSNARTGCAPRSPSTLPGAGDIWGTSRDTGGTSHPRPQGSRARSSANTGYLSVPELRMPHLQKNSEQKRGRGKGTSIPCRALSPNPSLLGSSPGLPFVPSRGCCHAQDRHVPPAVPAAALHLFLADARVRIRAVSLQGGI